MRGSRETIDRITIAYSPAARKQIVNVEFLSEYVTSQDKNAVNDRNHAPSNPSPHNKSALILSSGKR